MVHHVKKDVCHDEKDVCCVSVDCHIVPITPDLSCNHTVIMSGSSIHKTAER